MKILIFVFFTALAWGNASVNLSTPRETMRTFLTSMKVYKQGDRDELENALETIDLSHIDEASRSLVGELTAKRIINTIDRIKFVQYEQIPNSPDSSPWTFATRYSNKQKLEITIEKLEDGKFRFNQNTVESIEEFEKLVSQNDVVQGAVELSDWKTKLKSQMPIWTSDKDFILKNGQWLGLFAIIFLAILLAKLVRLYILSFILGVFKEKKLSYNDDYKKSLFSPFELTTSLIVVFIGIRILELPHGVLGVSLRLIQIALTMSSVWATLFFVEICFQYFTKQAEKTASKFDDILIPLLKTATKVFVFSIGLVFIGHSLTINVSNIIAGLGIGGLAFALAAKDTISNLFGSLTVVLDKPFEIGDWVTLGNGVEGNVEAVGFRSTRIRTFYDSQITVPNSQLTNIHIDNFGRRQYRRFSTKIGVEYSTPPEKIEAFCEGIRNLIASYPNTRKDYFNVYFTEMGSSSLNILLYVFFKVSDWSEELNEKHRLLIDILRLGNKMGVNFAFPTQTVHLFNEEQTTTENIKENYHEEGQKLAKDIYSDTLTPKSPRSKAENNQLPPLD